ncbi:hypothetical protein SAMN05428953_102671 [Mesorhizobium muleiense]|uniref:Uncharacterized protein n=1 Tax=Mesorhizobium muleiense TaxID=1004279 RepID=A0A1G8MT96_9HYPH|nr:hypothetical protein SAMN05428953_102671 [Mesorhizobium muleiense]
MQHLAKVSLVERLATHGAELEMLCFVLRGRPVALALDPGCGVVGFSRPTLIVPNCDRDGPTAAAE